MPPFFSRLLKLSSAHWHALGATIFAIALAVEVFGLQALSVTEFRLADVYARRHASEMQPDAQIVVVDIDDASMIDMQKVAGLWSWPREIHADLLEALTTMGPRAIVFDMTFSVHDSRRPASDRRLSEVIEASSNVYLAAVRLDSANDASGTALTPLAAAFGLPDGWQERSHAAIELPQVIERSAWRLGLINSVKDGDGVLRRYRLFTDVHGRRLPSLPARIVGDLGIALPAGEDFMMRWPQALHRHYSYGVLYRLLTEQRLQLDQAERAQLEALFRDKIVVIGSSATSAFDHHLTPLDSKTPGVDILAVAIDNLKNQHSLRIAPSAASYAFGALLIAMLAWGFARRKNPLALGAALASVSLAGLALADAMLAQHVLLLLATPLAFAWGWYLLAALGGYLQERRSREQAVALFGRFLHPSVVRQIVDQGETVESLSGRTSQVSVLFSDIRGFTSLSETRSPEQVVALLNRYFDRQVEVIFRHGGTLDKFIGDCIMAFWGAPVDDPEHAQHAVAAALEMQEVLLAFQRELQAELADVPDFEVGIGVHSGPAVVGFIGAQKKLDYTAIGDTVNLASRVEGLTKGRARLLVTKDTMLACGEASDIVFVPHGACAVKGRAAAVELYEPVRKS